MLLLGYVVGFGILAFGVLAVVGALIPDAWTEPPHPAKCDCMACGRAAAERIIRGRL